MTKIWCESLDEREYTEARIVSEGWFDYALSLPPGKPAPGPFPDTTLEILSDHPPPDFFQRGTLFTVSDRLKSVLEEFRVPAEYFPLRIVYGTEEYTERTFYFCNIVDCLECFDLARGKYTFWKKPGFTDRVDKIRKLAIDEEKAAGHDLFRIAKGGEYIVCVSDRVASKIVDRHLTGVRFIEPEDWRFGCG
jgi:hypothetical protein